MAFKTVFIAHAPDADYRENHSLIETDRYKLYTYVVKNQEEALTVCRDLYAKDKIDSVLLCPGFTHKDVAEIFEVLDKKVSVCVSRGDAPSNQITGPVLQREFFSK